MPHPQRRVAGRINDTIDDIDNGCFSDVWWKARLKRSQKRFRRPITHPQNPPLPKPFPPGPERKRRPFCDNCGDYDAVGGGGWVCQKL